MKPSHLSPSALLLSVSFFVVAPIWAQEKPESPPPAAPKKAEDGQKKSTTPPSQFARQRAKEMRARAATARKAGQQLVAERLQAAAKIWDKVAAHQEKAAKLEADAAQIERKTLEIKSQARRAHSLVEQTETRRSRAVARLRELGLSEPSEDAPHAAEGVNANDPAKKTKASPESKAGSR